MVMLRCGNGSWPGVLSLAVSGEIFVHRGPRRPRALSPRGSGTGHHVPRLRLHRERRLCRVSCKGTAPNATFKRRRSLVAKPVAPSDRLRFVVQKHDATRLHYDLAA